MNKEKPKENTYLQNLAQEVGIFLSPTMLDQFSLYKNILLESNRQFNLTRITESEEVDLKHFMDSLAVLPFLHKYCPNPGEGRKVSLVDVGTGAGFPGLALKIASPQIKLTLLDSLRKRVAFLDKLGKDLKLNEVTAVHMRAEEAGQNPLYREKFDISTARAVASLEQLAEYCLPLTRKGGIFLAMKAECKEEVKKAEYAIKLLGGKILGIEEYYLPQSHIFRTAVIIQKTSSTPSAYPRKPGRVKADPLFKL